MVKLRRSGSSTVSLPVAAARQPVLCFFLNVSHAQRIHVTQDHRRIDEPRGVDTRHADVRK